jgi:hypothetical protein
VSVPRQRIIQGGANGVDEAPGQVLPTSGSRSTCDPVTREIRIGIVDAAEPHAYRRSLLCAAVYLDLYRSSNVQSQTCITSRLPSALDAILRGVTSFTNGRTPTYDRCGKKWDEIAR